MRLKDIKLNTRKRKELFASDLGKLVKSWDLKDRDFRIAVSFLVIVDQKLQINLFDPKLLEDSNL